MSQQLFRPPPSRGRPPNYLVVAEGEAARGGAARGGRSHNLRGLAGKAGAARLLPAALSPGSPRRGSLLPPAAPGHCSRQNASLRGRQSWGVPSPEGASHFLFTQRNKSPSEGSRDIAPPRPLFFFFPLSSLLKEMPLLSPVPTISLPASSSFCQKGFSFFPEPERCWQPPVAPVRDQRGTADPSPGSYLGIAAAKPEMRSGERLGAYCRQKFIREGRRADLAEIILPPSPRSLRPQSAVHPVQAEQVYLF